MKTFIMMIGLAILISGCATKSVQSATYDEFNTNNIPDDELVTKELKRFRIVVEKELKIISSNKTNEDITFKKEESTTITEEKFNMYSPMFKRLGKE